MPNKIPDRTTHLHTHIYRVRNSSYNRWRTFWFFGTFSEAARWAREGFDHARRCSSLCQCAQHLMAWGWLMLITQEQMAKELQAQMQAQEQEQEDREEEKEEKREKEK